MDPEEKPKKTLGPTSGRADLARLRMADQKTIERNSPLELKGLPPEFWVTARIVFPTPFESRAGIKTRRAEKKDG